MKHMEIEYKWDANVPRAFIRATQAVQELCGKVVAKHLFITDTYLDDANNHLAKQLVALRVRNIGAIWEATFKTRSAVKQGKATRREETLALPSVKNLSQALKKLAQQKTWKDICTTNLHVRFSLKNKRTVYEFTYQHTQMEMALDRVTLYVAGRRVTMQEIELELKKGTEKKFDEFAQFFAQKTNLSQAKISKVKTAEALLNLWK